MSTAAIFGADPGGTTGWAKLWIPTANLVDRQIDLLDNMEFDCGQLTGPENFQAEELHYLLRDFYGPVLCEDFILRQFRQDPALLAPVRMTTLLEHVLWTLNKARGCGPPMQVRSLDVAPDSALRELRMRKQQPALAKSTATDDRLKEWGLYVPGQPHARDAIRQCITFARRAKQDRTLRDWAWPYLRNVS